MLNSGSKIVLLSAKVSLAFVVVAFLYGLVSFYTFGGKFLGLEEKGATINEVDIMTGDTVTPEILMDWFSVERDAPLFPTRSFFKNNLNLAHAYASANPTLASVSITKEFTGKVAIRAVERIPLVRIAGSGLAVDREGNVFAFRKAGMEGLVALEGTLPSSLQAGNVLVPSSLDASFVMAGGRTVPSAMGVAALRLVDYLADGKAAIPVSAIRLINTDSHDYLKLVFKDGRTATLAWDCMKSSQAQDGKVYLEAQIEGLAGAMSSRAGRAHRAFDFTVKGRGYGR